MEAEVEERRKRKWRKDRRGSGGKTKEEVEERYEKAIKMDPENVEAYFNRAWVARQYVFKMDSRIMTEECSKYSL